VLISRFPCRQPIVWDRKGGTFYFKDGNHFKVSIENDKLTALYLVGVERLSVRVADPQQKGGGCGNVEGEAGGEDPSLA